MHTHKAQQTRHTIRSETAALTTTRKTFTAHEGNRQHNIAQTTQLNKYMLLGGSQIFRQKDGGASAKGTRIKAPRK